MFKRFLLASTCLLVACQTPTTPSDESARAEYFDTTGREDAWTGGARLIPVETPSGTFNVWTKRVGNHPTIKVLLLHGGPGATHEYFESADSYFPGAGIEYYYYDQLGSGNSDNPQDTTLWTIERFVEEVEQVRLALGLDVNNFVLMGHSWGGILAMEYAFKYQENLKGLIISNMVASAPEYNDYAQNVLGPQLPPDVLAEIKALEAEGAYTSERYLGLITEHYYPAHVLRRPLEAWPEPVNRSFAKLNYPLYLYMQGPSEFGIVGNATLRNWDRTADLPKIHVPTLAIGAEFDTMDPQAMKYIATHVGTGTYLFCPGGGHMAMYDAADTYYPGIIDFLQKL